MLLYVEIAISLITKEKKDIYHIQNQQMDIYVYINQSTLIVLGMGMYYNIGLLWKNILEGI